MNRRNFLRRAFTGAAVLAAGAVVAKALPAPVPAVSVLAPSHWHPWSPYPVYRCNLAHIKALEAIQREQDEAIFKAIDAIVSLPPAGSY